MQDEEKEVGADEAPITISPEKVCFLIVKAREFDAKDEVAEPNPATADARPPAGLKKDEGAGTKIRRRRTRTTSSS